MKCDVFTSDLNNADLLFDVQINERQISSTFDALKFSFVFLNADACLCHLACK